MRHPIKQTTASLLFAILAACSTQGGSKGDGPKGGADANPGTGTATGSQSGTGTATASAGGGVPAQPADCATPASSAVPTQGVAGATLPQTMGAMLPGGATALQLATVTYADVQPIIAGKCATCHRTGGTPPDLSTYNGLVTNASAAVRAIASGAMPKPGGTRLTAAEAQTLQAWIAAGAPNAPTAPGANTGSQGTTLPGTTLPGATTTPSAPASPGAVGASNCLPAAPAGGGVAGTGAALPVGGAKYQAKSPTDQVFLDGLIIPPALNACLSRGLLYNRVTGQCDTAQATNAYTCDHAGFLQAYGNNAAVENYLSNRYDPAHWTYDQCGTEGGHPVLYLMCVSVNGVCAAAGSVVDVSEVRVQVARIPSATPAAPTPATPVATATASKTATKTGTATATRP